MIGIDRLSERLTAEVAQLDSFIRNQIDILEALKKTQLYFATRNGGVTPKQAEQLLLGSPVNGTPPPGIEIPWRKQIMGALQDGPKTTREIWAVLSANGIPHRKRAAFSQALWAMQKNGIVTRTGFRGTCTYSLPANGKAPAPAAKERGPRGRWEAIITAAISDGAPRLPAQIWDLIDIGQKDRATRTRFGVTLPYLAKKGTLHKDKKTGEYSLATRRKLIPTPVAKKARGGKPSDGFGWTPAIRAILADGTPRTLAEIWKEMEARHAENEQVTRRRFNTAMPRLRAADHVARDKAGRYTLGRRTPHDERDADHK